MQCPACQYESTMKEQVDSPDKCPSCGIYYEKFASKQASLKDAALTVETKSGGIAGAKEAVWKSRATREAEERAQRSARSSPEAVSIVDFNVPFWSLVMFLVKLAFAAIPAAIIISLLISGAASVLAVLNMIFG